MRTVVTAIALLLVATGAQSQFNRADIERRHAETDLAIAQAQQAQLQNQVLTAQLRNLELQNQRLAAPCKTTP